MPKCQKCGKELTVKNGVYVCVDCKLKYSTIPVPTEEHHEKVVQTTQPIQKSVEGHQPVEEPAIQSVEKKPKRKWTRKTKEERKADQIGTNYGKTQYAMGMLLLLFGIIPGIVIALATGNRKTIAGMKMGLIILLILALSAGIITGLVFAGIAIDIAIEDAQIKANTLCYICGAKNSYQYSVNGHNLCYDCYIDIEYCYTCDGACFEELNNARIFEYRTDIRAWNERVCDKCIEAIDCCIWCDKKIENQKVPKFAKDEGFVCEECYIIRMLYKRKT